MVVGWACMVAGGCAWLSGACMAGGHVWLGGVHGCGGHAWLPGGVHMIQQDTVNERAVRILLECILVILAFSLQRGKNTLAIFRTI